MLHRIVKIVVWLEPGTMWEAYSHHRSSPRVRSELGFSQCFTTALFHYPGVRWWLSELYTKPRSRGERVRLLVWVPLCHFISVRFLSQSTIENTHKLVCSVVSWTILETSFIKREAGKKLSWYLQCIWLKGSSFIEWKHYSIAQSAIYPLINCKKFLN